MKLVLEEGIKLNSNFDSEIKLEEKIKYSKLLRENSIAHQINRFDGKFSNNILLNFDKTYKLKNYNYKITGKINQSDFKFSKSIKNEFFKDAIQKIVFSNLLIEANFSPKNYKLVANGKYSLNNLDFLNINLLNTYDNNLSNFKIDFDYNNSFEIDFINFKKSKNSISNLIFEFKKKNKKIFLKNLQFKEGQNLIKIKDLDLKENEILSFSKIEVSTTNNNFVINNQKKITIKGDKLDATHLTKHLDNKKNNNQFKNFSKSIEIDLKNIKIPMSEKLENFKLLGKIHKGKFVKISSKGDFGGNNFLDIIMKENKKNNTKYLEIYSDLTRPLLSDYNFFKGLSGGKCYYLFNRQVKIYVTIKDRKF